MAATISEGARKLLEEPNLAHLATLMTDGSPQCTPVWVDFDGTHVLVNTAEGRQKPKNIRRDPRVAISVANRENPYQQISIRGRATLTTDEADKHIDRLAKKYLGQDRYPFRREGEQRIIVRIKPEHVSGMA